MNFSLSSGSNGSAGGKKRHVIITGGAGFVGSHLCELFLSRGYAVTAVDNLVTGRESNVAAALKSPDFSLVIQDVCAPLGNWSDLPLLSQHGLHGVLHFACPASPIDFERIPMEILAVDSVGTMHTVELAQRFKARYLIASTSEVYGDPLVHPQSEEYRGNVSTTGPRACYDEAKRFAEAYVSSATRWKGLNGAIVRIFNTYGPRMRLNDGRVVPELCAQAMAKVPFTLHGDGEQTRSFCFVSDLVEGIFRLFESDHHDPVNLGNPKEITIRTFAEKIAELENIPLAVNFQAARPDDPRRRCPDITRARTWLDWSPQVDLAEGLRRSLAYFRLEAGN